MLEQILRFSTISMMVIAVIVQLYFYRRNNGGDSIILRTIFRGTLCVSLLTTTFWALCSGWSVFVDGPMWLISYLLIIVGISLRIWAQFALKSMWSAGVRILTNHILIDKGPYRFLRHPMYIGYGLVGIGTILLTQNTLILCSWLLFFVLLFQRALEESTALHRKFGDYFLNWTAGRAMIGPPIWLTLRKINQ